MSRLLGEEASVAVFAVVVGNRPLLGVAGMKIESIAEGNAPAGGDFHVTLVFVLELFEIVNAFYARGYCQNRP